MTPQEVFLQLICETAEKNCNLGTKISPKELSPKGGLYAELGEGFGEGGYYDKGAHVRTMPVLFLCRYAEQKKCISQLSEICNYLVSLKQYPQGENVAWLNAEIAKEPNKIGRDEDGMCHYSCIINCKVYY